MFLHSVHTEWNIHGKPQGLTDFRLHGLTASPEDIARAHFVSHLLVLETRHLRGPLHKLPLQILETPFSWRYQDLLALVGSL